MLKDVIKNIFFKKTFLVASSILVLNGCDKGGSSFSVLSDSASFEQTAVFKPRKLDVLFVIDNSGSMATSQTNLANNFSSFIDRFISKGYDFKIAVTTTDAFYGDEFVSNGCSLCTASQAKFRSGVTPSPVYVIDKLDYDLGLPSEIVRLKNNFSSNALVGVAGGGDERAFSSFKAALNSSLNLGFHRSDAFLSIVIISDEEDFSNSSISMNESYTNPLLYTVGSYKSYLDTFTAGNAGVNYSVSTISILDETCRASLGAGRKIGQRYMQLADLTSGSKNSLCSPFDTSLDNISATIEASQSSVYSLNKTPVVSSIRVIINGILVPENGTNGWTYDSVANSIEIHGTYKPITGDNVLINFDPFI
jgi:hypothetical protein